MLYTNTLDNQGAVLISRTEINVVHGVGLDYLKTHQNHLNESGSLNLICQRYAINKLKFYGKVDEQDIQSLGSIINNTPCITVIDLRCWEIDNNVMYSLMTTLRGTAIQRLGMSGSIEGVVLETLATGLRDNPVITEIDIVCGEGIEYFAPILNKTSIQKLQINSYMMDSGNVSQLLTNLPDTTTTLSLRGNINTQDMLQVIVHNISLDITDLTLSIGYPSSLSAEQLIYLAKELPNNIINLNVNVNYGNLTNEEISKLCLALQDRPSINLNCYGSDIKIEDALLSMQNFAYLVDDGFNSTNVLNQSYDMDSLLGEIRDAEQ